MRLIGLNDADTVRLLEADQEQTIAAEHLESNTSVKVKENMAVPRRKLVRLLKAVLAVSVLATIFASIYYCYTQRDGEFSFSIFAGKTVYKLNDAVKLKLTDNTLSFADDISGQFLKVKLIGDSLIEPPELDSCLKILGNADAEHARKLKLGLDPFVNSLCMKWKNTVLVVNRSRARGSRCFAVQWSTTESRSPENCFAMSGSHWYGGSLLRDQQWPLEDVSIPMQPFISSPIDVFQSKNFRRYDYGPVLERMWISSGGFGIVADSEEPLHVSVNAHKKSFLCLKTQFQESSNMNIKQNSPLSLKYTVCMDRSAKHIHEHLVKNFITLPDSAPPEALMQDPVWSIRGINMNSLTQTQALSLRTDILKYYFLHSQFHIAGNITRTIGGIYLDHARFPNAHQMIGEIKSDGLSVSTSILPVMEEAAYDFEEGQKLGAFVSLDKSQAVQWQGKTVALINFSNPAACEWMTKRFNNFKSEAPVKAFHFDNGEAVLLSQVGPMQVPLPNPCDYSTHYAKFAYSLNNSNTIGVGYRSQQFPLMVDIGARNSTWGYDLGLKSIIPSVLTLGLLGYPFVTVGPVGGVPVNNFEQDRNRFSLPDEELYIRWLQLSAFLPGLEMSVGPWQYSRQVTDIAHKLFKFRADRIFPVLQTAVKEFLRTGAPIIRPVWWMAYGDEVAQRIDCEFVISNLILVAPVLDAGARRRDIYLPKVKDLKWKDTLRGDVYEGGQWLHGYKVDLTEVATFTPVMKSQSEYHLQH